MKLVLADYFLGFSTRNVSGGARPWRLYYESEEDAGIKPPKCDAAFSGDLYINGDIKDIASTYYPAIGPYDVEDPDVVEYHVLLAKSAGIDGFMAEFTMGQEKKLLSLVKAAKKHDFRIGVNWITQSHLAENTWPDRATAIARAHDLVRWMVEHVYKPCGVKLHERYLMLAFLSHPREATKPFDPFFSPTEIAALKQAAIDAGCDLDIFTLPWEQLPELPEGATGERVWDGYFPWVWSSSGGAISEDACWSRVTTREQYIDRLRDYYAMSTQLKKQGRIGNFLGAVLLGFDDHKGQAWGEGLKRHLPRDGGQTLKDTWTELQQSRVDAALIITWNDWVESSQIEPSLELGNADLLECARQIAAWKGEAIEEPMLSLPHRLLEARRATRFLADAGISKEEIASIAIRIDGASAAIASRDCDRATRELDRVERVVRERKQQIISTPIHLFWEFGFDSVGIHHVASPGIEKVTAGTFAGLKLGGDTSCIGFAIDDSLRQTLQRGCFVARLSIEYLDTGVDFIRVLVDAPDPSHQEIASFKKSDTGRWRNASIELVNARFVGGLDRGADLQVSQRSTSAGGVRGIRIDGTLHVRDSTVTSSP